ncbi:MAG: UDP-N-acetylmuramoyl-L-alanyl-D-glutamate--2,6-diaminopimelate ligase [Defluviitaleaceae bacterium]|nr:UDP-N-acetylmuramoyl-L-alanyl-D-glutamate--2,6-diaminopimelate ligase [Defluviitaleaceae bacterium]
MKMSEVMQGIACEIIQHGDAEGVDSIIIDSRKVGEGGLFVCLRGLQVDGHCFINDVAQKGASAVVIDRDQDTYPPGLTILKVKNARKSLSAIAANFYGRPADKLRLFGVTGTNGKTSTTYIMDSILRQAGKPGLIGTVGIHLGGKNIDIPFSTSTTPDPPELQQIFNHMLNNGAKDVVMEVSSHALALYKMENLFFEVAVFTNLTQDHLDFHGTMENYLAAKAKLFGQCRYGIVNGDDQYSPQIMTIGNCEKWITFGIDNDCDIRAIHIEELPEGSAFDVEINGALEHFYLPVKGRFNIYNALATIGAALVVGIDVEQIRAGLASFEGVPGRIQAVPNDKGFHVLVDYAHSPDGLVNIINSVRAFTTGRVITLFGCGGDKDMGKRPIMGRIAGELSDHCIVTSDNPRSEPPEEIIHQVEAGLVETSCPYDSFVDRRTAIYHGIAMLEPGDAFIIAGKGHENYQIVNNKTIHFDDVEVANEALKER